MASWGRFDYKQFERLQRKLERLKAEDIEAFCRAAAKELAARLLSKVIKRTPVGRYKDGRTGGTLRRNWTVSGVDKGGNTYQVDVINNTLYAAYVEYGHRTRGSGWADGRFMLTISAQELERSSPALLQKKLENFLRQVFL